MNATPKTDRTAYAQMLVASLNAAEDRNYDWGYDPGKKYARIWHAYKGTEGQGVGSGCSVYCFIDNDGKVWYPAGWTGPQKNFPRGDVSTESGMSELVAKASVYPFGGGLAVHS